MKITVHKSRGSVVQNQSMKRLLAMGEAKDVSTFLQPDGDYLLPEGFYEEGKDYCDAKREAWIWSIGKFPDGRIVAATSSKFYQNPECECIWLR